MIDPTRVILIVVVLAALIWIFNPFFTWVALKNSNRVRVKYNFEIDLDAEHIYVFNEAVTIGILKEHFFEWLEENDKLNWVGEKQDRGTYNIYQYFDLEPNEIKKDVRDYLKLLV